MAVARNKGRSMRVTSVGASSTSPSVAASIQSFASSTTSLVLLAVVLLVIELFGTWFIIQRVPCMDDGCNWHGVGAIG
jgi:sensor histidine kinase regulating citrate/malate metabolism